MQPLLDRAAFGVPMPILILTGCLVLLVLLVGLMLAPSGSSKKRVAAVVARTRRDPKDQSALINAMIMRPKDKGNGSIEGILRRVLPNPQLLRDRLQRGGLTISLGHYVMIVGVVFVVATIGIWRFAGLPLIAAALFGVTIGFMLPHFYVGMKIGKRKAKFLNHFPEAIDLIVRGLKSGLPVTESIKTVATEIPAPVGTEFQAIADALNFGTTFDEALWQSAVRVNLPDFNFFVITLEVQRETGGNLAETLENLSDVLRKRKQAKMKVKALSGEAKASAYIIGALPFIMFGLISAVNSDYVGPLFDDPRGQVMTGIGLFWMTVGHVVMAKMIRFEI